MIAVELHGNLRVKMRAGARVPVKSARAKINSGNEDVSAKRNCACIERSDVEVGSEKMTVYVTIHRVDLPKKNFAQSRKERSKSRYQDGAFFRQSRNITERTTGISFAQLALA
ncbi:MAG TPA: hypothetical protein VF452_01980 [Candidatus Binatia bacterium]